ncbi:hypothetical protein [Streptomyces sp. NPDC057325]|uniref:hypothetical protein n=1 Tax=unclassified Streptomyces TaxID=2593676 RepID=UPI00362AC8F0
MADRLHLLQLGIADRLVRKHANAVVTAALLRAQALAVTDDMYGTGPYADQVEEELVESLPPIRGAEARSEYAARLRLVAEGVVQ